MTPRRLLAAAAVLAAAFVALVVGAAPASAHAILVGSDPSDGATLGTAPTQLHLRLSEAVMPGTTKIRITDGAGRTVALGAVRVGATAQNGPALIYRAGDPGAPTTITVDLPALAPDVYRVAWQTLSAADLHLTSGVVVFGVQRGVTAAAEPVDDPVPPVSEVALRWLALVGAALATGVLVVAHLAGPLVTVATRRRLLVTGAAAGGVSAVAGAGLVAVQARLDGAGLGQVLASGYGVRWGVRELVALALAVVAGVLAGRRNAPSRPVAWLAAGGALAFAAATAALGHTGAAGLSQPVRFAADAVHVGAALVWLGLVLAVAVVATDRTARPAWRDLARRIGVLAGLSVGALTVTGLLLVAAEVVSLDAMLVSTYGRLLLVKLAVAAAGGVAAALVATRLRPELVPARVRSRAPLRRSLVVAEAVALVGVVGLAAAVASARPASGPEWVPASAAVPITSGQVRDLVETVAVSPNRPGRNFLTVDVFQTRRPEPGPITAVTAVLRRPGAAPVTVPLQPERNGRWVTPTDAFEAPGAWTVDVVVQRAGVGTDTAPYGWLVADPAARLARPVVSSSPWQTPLEIAAVVLAALLAVTGWAVRRAVRRARPDAGAPEANAAGNAEDLDEEDAEERVPADAVP